MTIKSNKEIGHRIKELRELKGISRAELCADESQLSHRQLIRIEQGDSVAGVDKIQFIAQQLGTTLVELLSDKQTILPESYLLLKQKLRENPYLDKKLLLEKFEILDTIYQDYIDILPEEELLFLEIMERLLQIRQSKEGLSPKVIFSEWFSHFSHKTFYDLNDVLIANYYLQYTQVQNDFDKTELQQICDILLSIEISLDNDFNRALLNTLGNATTVGVLHNDYSFMKPLLDRMNEIINKIKDYAIKPQLLSSEAKYYFYEKGDKDKASNLYNLAEQLCKIYNNDILLDMVREERKKDFENHL